MTQYTATHCIMLHHTTPHCNALQYTAAHIIIMRQRRNFTGAPHDRQYNARPPDPPPRLSCLPVPATVRPICVSVSLCLICVCVSGYLTVENCGLEDRYLALLSPTPLSPPSFPSPHASLSREPALLLESFPLNPAPPSLPVLSSLSPLSSPTACPPCVVPAAAACARTPTSMKARWYATGDCVCESDRAGSCVVPAHTHV